jgi:hypothetical protein
MEGEERMKRIRVAVFMLAVSFAISAIAPALALEGNSSITCAVSKWQIYFGESITVSGAITPVHAGVGVTLKYTDPAYTTFNRTVTSIGDGSYSDIILPSLYGMWSVQASWSGDIDNLGNVSSTVKFLVSTVSDVAIKIGRNQTFSCVFQPAMDYYYSPISFQKIAYNQSVTSPGGINFSALGQSFSYAIPPFGIGGTITSFNLTYYMEVLAGTSEGVYNATAYYDIYSQSTLWPYSSSFLFRYELRCRINVVGKYAASINLSLPQQVKLGEVTSVSGTIAPSGGSPVTGVNVTLSYKKPDGSAVNRTSMTKTDGSFKDEYIPDVPGTWSVKASWIGDIDHNETESRYVQFTVLADIQHQVTVDIGVYFVHAISNSTISDFNFDQSLRQIGFNLTGVSGTMGFCNITVPAVLMSGTFSVFRDDVLLVKNVDYTESYNGTHTALQIFYNHSGHVIKITASQVIPEFSPNLLVIFVVLALLAVAAYCGKRFLRNKS